jgi:GntR family transcriptional repressor for pyruvate dehydrogenase complex
MRAAIATDVARLCAERAPSSIRSELVAIAAEMRKTEVSSHLFRLEVRFWDRAVEGAQNLAYRLAFNSLIKSAQAMGSRAEEWSAADLRANDYRRAIADAIAGGDAARAEAEARDSMRKAVAVLAAAMGTPAEEAPAPIAVPARRRTRRAK